MKRWHTKLAVFVLLGVVVNIAVAWGIAWRHEFWSVTGDGQVSIGYSSASDPRWFVGMVTKPGTTYLGFGTGSHVRADPDKFEVIAGDLPDWSLASQPPVRRGTSGTSEPIGFTEVAYGWPAVTLFYRMGGIDPTGFTGIPPIYGGLRLPERSLPKDIDALRVLPLRPIWPGFAINTVFHAVMVWMLWSSPFAARRLVRHKRGHCLKCGYDLRGDFSAGCPECGWRREGLDEPKG